MHSPWRACSALLALLAAVNPVYSADSVQSFNKATNESLFWGPYRSNVFFGLRPRAPDSFISGLMWSKLTSVHGVQNAFRHTCEQSDEIKGYGWEEYDARRGGRHVVYDNENSLDFSTEWVKFPGGDHGGSWGVRVRGKPRPGAEPDMPSTVVFYVGLEGDGKLEPTTDYEALGYSGDVTFQGSSKDLGDFTLTVTKGPASNRYPASDHPSAPEQPLDRTRVNALSIPKEQMWQAKPLFFNQVKLYLEPLVEEYTQENLPPEHQAFTLKQDEEGTTGNYYIVQKVFENSFQFDILFSSGSAGKTITGTDLSTGIQKTSKEFSDDYKKVFKPARPFDINKYDAFSKSLFSNLLGGVGYFHGDQLIDRSYDDAYREDDEGFWEEAEEARKSNQPSLEGPYTLFTAVPSRSFFPRGFLWDEGFHLLPILDWDRPMTLEILKSWFKTMDVAGWIPREQILGAEARSKVPPEFAVQYPHYANPPTLFMAVEAFANRLLSDKGSDIPSEEKAALTEGLKELYPLLKLNWEWYRKTQRGDFKSYERKASDQKEGYRWRGRTPRHILTSGLDDYPRAQPPSPGELHVDLLSWIGLMTRSLKSTALALGQKKDATELATIEKAIAKNIDDLHWSDAEKTFCDTTVDAYEETQYVCNKGYVSIFPFMTGMIEPSSPHLGAVLDLIADPEELWSEHGIRSLSKKHELYGQDENYWRSPVWVQMNYLVLENLLKVAQTSGPHQEKAKEMYEKLRRNIVETVYESWKETGFAWEQYNPETGKGQRTQHFTGWTSLVVKIMGMPDLSEVKADKRPRVEHDHSHAHEHGHEEL